MSDVTKMVGPETLKRARETRWWAFAAILGEILYNCDVVQIDSNPDGYWKTVKPTDPPTPYGYRHKFCVTAYQTVLNIPKHHKIPGRTSSKGEPDGDAYEVRAVLRALQAECERAALREVCP